MKKRSIILIIGLMSVALLGVMGMQLYFLQQSYSLQTKIFDQNVNLALTNVVDKLQKHDAINFLVTKVETKKTKPLKRHNSFKIRVQPPEEHTKPVAKVETFASQLLREQKKADSIFAIRDSLMRKRYPTAVVFNDVASADQPDGPHRLEVGVSQYVDANGQAHETTVARAVPSRQIWVSTRGNNIAGNATIQLDSVRR